MMSSQAWVMAVCNLLIFGLMIAAVVFAKKDAEEGNKAIAVIKTVVGFLFIFVIMALQVYSLNCMVVGDCQLWSWIIAILSVISTLVFIGGLIYIYYVTKKISTVMDEVSKASSS